MINQFSNKKKTIINPYLFCLFLRSSCLPPPRMLESSALAVFTATTTTILSLTARTATAPAQSLRRKTSTTALTLPQKTPTTYRSLALRIAVPLWALRVRRSIITTTAVRFRRTRTRHRSLTALASTALASTALPVRAAHTVTPAAAVAASSPVGATPHHQKAGFTDMASPPAMGRCVTMTTVWFQHLLRH